MHALFSILVLCKNNMYKIVSQQSELCVVWHSTECCAFLIMKEVTTMKHITKCLSIVLALLMLTSVFAVAPITASATETTQFSTGKDSGKTGEC